jgi:ABC-type transport system involved in multi-copper enzyme maturation permease subunit
VTYMGIEDFKKQAEAYHTAIIQNQEEIAGNLVYATLEPKAVQPVSVLSVISKGISRDVGHTVTFSLTNIPYEAENEQNPSPYSTELRNLDLLKILIWLLSIIAIIISYDMISGEYEQGTLKLVLSCQLSRYRYFISKFIAGLIVMGLLSLLVAAIVLTLLSLNSAIQLSANEYLRLSLIFIALLLFAIFWLLTGLFFSALVKSPGKGMIFSLAVWVTLMMIVPAISNTLLGRVDFINERKTLREQEQLYWDRYGKKSGRLWQMLFDPLIEKLEFGTGGGGPDSPPVRFPNEKTFNAIQRFQEELIPLKLKIAEDKFKLAETVLLNPLAAKVRKSNFLAWFSPVQSLENCCADLAGTSNCIYFNFLQQTQIYRNRVLQYFQEKNAYKSYRWWALEPVPWGTEHPIYIEEKDMNETWWKEFQTYSLQLTEDPDFRLKLNDFPLFEQVSRPYAMRFDNAIIYYAVNGLLCLIILTAGLFAFERFDL